MRYQNPIGAIALIAILCATTPEARAWDDAKYPDWKGMWERIGGGSFDPSKRPGRAQQPPLTAEYQAVWERNLRDEATGGQDYNPQVRCLLIGANAAEAQALLDTFKYVDYLVSGAFWQG